MKRRITSMLLAAAMTITMLTGCGSQGKETEKQIRVQLYWTCIIAGAPTAKEERLWTN